MGSYSAVANCFRILFIILNFFFVILGAAIIGFGSWLLYLGNENNYDVITGDNIFSGAALLITAGFVTFILSALGIIGACGMWRPLLIIYIVFISVLVVLEIATGILSFVFRNDLTSELENRMNDIFIDYRAVDAEGYSKEVNDFVTHVQKTFECCGVNSTFDWLEYHPDLFSADGNKPPSECLCTVGEDDHCMSFNFTYIPPGVFVEQRAIFDAWNRGCLDAVEDSLTYFNPIAIGVGILGIIIGIVEFFGIIVAVGLIVCISKTTDYTKLSAKVT